MFPLLGLFLALVYGDISLADESNNDNNNDLLNKNSLVSPFKEDIQHFFGNGRSKVRTLRAAGGKAKGEENRKPNGRGPKPGPGVKKKRGLISEEKESKKRGRMDRARKRTGTKSEVKKRPKRMKKTKKKGDKNKRSKSKGNKKPKKSKFARRKFRLQHRLKKAQESRLQTEVCLFTIAINNNESKLFKVSWFR